MNKDVALVLSSGGPRGFAYIGALDEYERTEDEQNSVMSGQRKSVNAPLRVRGGRLSEKSNIPQ